MKTLKSDAVKVRGLFSTEFASTDVRAYLVDRWTRGGGDDEDEVPDPERVELFIPDINLRLTFDLATAERLANELLAKVKIRATD